MKPSIFEYNGKKITFEFSDGNRMVNATEMAKPFGKLVADFLRLKTTQPYIALLEKRYGISHIGQNKQEREILRVVKGGDTDLQGTWMDEKLALKFASWLSPEFELWVYDRIEELLLKGTVSIKPSNPKGFAQTLRLLAEKFEEQEQINLDHHNRISEIESKLISSDDNYYTIAGFCSLHKIHCPLESAKAWGKLSTALSNERGYPTGIAHDERYGKVKTYHKDVLKVTVLGLPF